MCGVWDMGVVTTNRDRVVGIITTELCTLDGQPFGRDVRTNVVTDAGLAQMASLLAGVSKAPFAYMQIGTGARVAVGEDVPNPRFNPEKEESAANRRYLPAGSVKPMTAKTTRLYTFAEEQRATVSVVGAAARFAARFEIPLAIPISEAGVFNGLRETSPTPLCAATFMDTVQRIKRTGAVPTTESIWFNVTWDVGFAQHPYEEGYHEQETAI